MNAQAIINNIIHMGAPNQATGFTLQNKIKFPTNCYCFSVLSSYISAFLHIFVSNFNFKFS